MNKFFIAPNAVIRPESEALFTATIGYDLGCMEAETRKHTPTLRSVEDGDVVVIPRGTRVPVRYQELFYEGKWWYYPPSVLNIASKESLP